MVADGDEENIGPIHRNIILVANSGGIPASTRSHDTRPYEHLSRTPIPHHDVPVNLANQKQGNVYA